MLRIQPTHAPIKVAAQDSLQAKSSSLGAAHKSWGCNPSDLITQHSWGHSCCGWAVQTRCHHSSSVIPSVCQRGGGNQVHWCVSTPALLSLTGRQMKSQVIPEHTVTAVAGSKSCKALMTARGSAAAQGLLAWGTPGTHSCISLERKWRATGKQTLPILSLQ